MKLGELKGTTPGAKKEKKEWELIPEGDYEVTFLDFELKETKSKNGHYVKGKFETMVEGKGRMLLYNNFNVDNPNATAQKIGRRDINLLSKVLGGPDEVTDTDMLEDLKGGKFIGKIIVRENKNPDFGDYNQILKFFKK